MNIRFHIFPRNPNDTILVSEVQKVFYSQIRLSPLPLSITSGLLFRGITKGKKYMCMHMYTNTYIPQTHSSNLFDIISSENVTAFVQMPLQNLQILNTVIFK